MTLSEFEGYLLSETFVISLPITHKPVRFNYDMFTHKLECARGL